MDAKRTFLSEVISAGLEHGTMTPDDLLSRLTPEVLADHLPRAQSAKLLQASLTARSMSPTLIVDTIGVAVLTEHLPVPVLWSCVADAAERALSVPPGDRPAEPKATPSAAKPATASSKADPGKADPGKADPGKVVAKAPVPKPNVSKSTPAPSRGGGAFSRLSGAPSASAGKPRTRRGSDFDVDTDVGEEWPPAEPLREAEALGAAPEIVEIVDEADLTDWPQEETRNVDISTGPKR